MPDQVVSIEPTPVVYRQNVKLRYRGSLFEQGKQRIYAHAGYGSADAWQNVADYPMERGVQGFEATIAITDDSRFNVCFHDGYGQWDNNGGHNWSWEIHNGNLY